MERPRPQCLPLFLVLAVAAAPLGCALDRRRTNPAAGPRLAQLPSSNRHDFDHPALGRTFHVTCYADTSARAEEAAAAARARLTDLSSKIDAALPDSELSRLCDSAGGPWGKVSDELMLLLQQTRRLSELHGGGADVTAGPLSESWRAAFEAGALPADEALDDARAAVGWQKVQVDPIERRVRLLLPGMRIDLGQRAVAFAADRVLDELAHHDVTAAIVDTGDVTAASGPPPGRAGWPLTLPPAGPKQESRTLHLRHAAVARLGDDPRVKTIAGRTFTDRVDPRTGLGVSPQPYGDSTAFPAATTVIAGKAFPAAQGAALALSLSPDRLAILLRTSGGVTIQMRRPLQHHP